jgi:hypothetical protein
MESRKKEHNLMNNTKIALFAGAVVIVAAGLVLAIRSNPSTSSKDGQGTIARPTAQMEERNPFTNVASIPATIDPSTIRFEKLRMVELASKTKTSTDPQNCKDAQFRDPDGSNCKTVTVEERVKGLEAKYSYSGAVIASGESVPGRDEFSVYFRADELPVSGAVDKLNREQAASLFELSTSRPMVEQKFIDKEHSKFCEGNYVDGNWTRTDPKCQDQVQYMTKAVPSPNLLVQVDVRHPAAMATH